MAVIKGACISRKGRYYVVNLIMARQGGKVYEQIYGSYIREQEALVKCRRINKAGSCGVCQRSQDCTFPHR